MAAHADHQEDKESHKYHAEHRRHDVDNVCHRLSSGWRAGLVRRGGIEEYYWVTPVSGEGKITDSTNL